MLLLFSPEFVGYVEFQPRFVFCFARSLFSSVSLHLKLKTTVTNSQPYSRPIEVSIPLCSLKRGTKVNGSRLGSYPAPQTHRDTSSSPNPHKMQVTENIWKSYMWLEVVAFSVCFPGFFVASVHTLLAL